MSQQSWQSKRSTQGRSKRRLIKNKGRSEIGNAQLSRRGRFLWLAQTTARLMRYAQGASI